MFIKLTAAYHSKEQPDFGALGIKEVEEDFDNCIWDSLWVKVHWIVDMNVNSSGYTEIDLITGKQWCVKETPKQVIMQCSACMKLMQHEASKF